jgi:error-prone DNA polymerase
MPFSRSLKLQRREALWAIKALRDDRPALVRANLVIWPTLYEKQRRVILGASLLGVDGRIQREGDVVHLVAYKVHDLGDLLQQVQDRSGDQDDMAWARRSRNFC